MAITFEMRGRYGPVGSGPAAADTPDRSRAFEAARRHSRLVKGLRIALPTTALAVAAAYAIILNGGWKLGPGRLSVGRIELTADDLSMKNPSYFGVTKDGGRYQVRAKRAVMEFGEQKAPIKLIDIDGDLTQSDNVTTKLKAKQGLLDNANGRLELYDGIEIDATNGMAARMSRAMIFMKEHRVVSEQPVTATTPTGSVRSAAMTLRTDTHRATFKGSVAVRLSGTQSIGGFGNDSRQPIEVSSDQLDVDDSVKVALFTGSVVATQGESNLRSPELTVVYEGKGAAVPSGGAAKSDGQETRLSRLSATGGAVVTAGSDRRVTSDTVDFDAKTDTVLFKGAVVVNQGRNVLNGRRLFVDRKAGKSRLDTPAEGGQPPGRIAATFYQTDGKTAQPKSKSTGAEAASAVQGEIFGSFKTDPNAPFDIEADSLDINDMARQAVFHTNVRAQQGDFVVRTVELMAVYSGQTGLGLGVAATSDKTPPQLVRIEAKQKVLITSTDGQTATGDWAIFDMKSNTVLMGGRVIVTRGKDVAEGPRLKIDLTTGMYRFELADGNTAASASTSAPVSPVTPPASPAEPARPTAVDATKRSCPPGKQCLLFYPKDAQERAKEIGKKVLPNLPSKSIDGWQSSTSASEPIRRGD
jgi:LPS export ABC transporter protein LptC